MRTRTDESGSAHRRRPTWTRARHGVAAVAATLAVTTGACGSGFGTGDARVGGVADRPVAVQTAVNPWAAANAAIARCDTLPSGYVPVEPEISLGGGDVDAWAAGDAAAAQRLNELAHDCAALR